MNESLRGWRVLLATLAALALIAWADQRVVDSAPLHGLRPKDADWIMSTTDFPGFWKRLEHGDVFQRLEEDWSRPQSAFELAVRQASGIRPTPLRWRIWLGQRLTLAHAPEGIGLCVYPGILLRAVGSVDQLLGPAADESGVRSSRGTYYAWRGGNLIVSQSHDYVQACLQDGDTGPLRSSVGGELAFQWGAPYEGYLRTLPGSGLRIEGRIKAPFRDGDRPLTLTNAWPSTPLAAITVRRAADLRLLGAILDRAVGATQELTEAKRLAGLVWGQWGMDALPDGWDADVDHLAIMVQDINVDETLPVPTGAAVFRSASAANGPHPLAALAENRRTIPYEWQGQPGVYIPLLGEQCSLCLGQYGRDWIATSDEPEMAALAGALSPGPVEAADVDLTIRVSWDKTAAVVKSLVFRAAQLELIPGVNGDDVQQNLPPVMDALSHLGTMELDGRAGDGWLAFEGALFQPAKLEGQ